MQKILYMKRLGFFCAFYSFVSFATVLFRFQYILNYSIDLLKHLYSTLSYLIALKGMNANPLCNGDYR